MNNEKEYVSLWVTKETAKELKNLESAENEKSIVKKVAKDLSLNIETELGQLEEDQARYKAACIVFKNSLKEVYNEQQEQIEEIINSQWDIMPKVKEETSKMITQIQMELLPLREELLDTKKQIEEMRQMFNEVNWYGASSFLDVVEKIKGLSVGNKELLKIILNQNKTEQ